MTEAKLTGRARAAAVWVAGCAAAACCAAAEATTNAFARAMHAVVVPEIHFRPAEAQHKGGPPGDPYSAGTDAAWEFVPAASNQNCFAVHARNLTALQVVDLICFLSDSTYAFGSGGLVVAPTNLPTVRLQQDAKREKAIIAKLKTMEIPEVTFRPPANILDALDYFYQASMDYDDPEIPAARRGLNFAVKNPHLLRHRKNPEGGVPRMCDFGGICSFYAALTNVCGAVDARFTIRDDTVVIYPAAAP